MQLSPRWVQSLQLHRDCSAHSSQPEMRERLMVCWPIGSCLWVKRFVAAVFVGCCLLGGTLPAEGKPILIQPEVQYQRFDGFGITIGNGAAREVMELPEKDRARLMDMLFGPEGAHLNLVRNEITWTAKRLPMTHPMFLRGLRFYFADEQSETNQFNFFREAQKRNEIISYSCAWTPPPVWKTNSSELGGGELTPEHYEDFAFYLGAYIDFYKKLRYHEIPFLSFQNNPILPGPAQSCLWSPEQTRKFLTTLGRQFREQGITSQLSLPELDWDKLKGYLESLLADAETRQWISLIAAHSYSGSRKDREEIKELYKQLNVKLWQTEYALPAAKNSEEQDGGLLLAEQVMTDLLYSECQAWFYWAPLAPRQWNDRLALLDSEGKSFRLTKRFWCLAQFSRFVSHNSVRILVSGGTAQVIAFRNPGYTAIAVVFINNSSDSITEEVQTRNWSLERMAAFRTSQGEDCSVIPAPAQGGSKLSLTLTPRSVTTLTAQIRRIPVR